MRRVSFAAGGLLTCAAAGVFAAVVLASGVGAAGILTTTSGTTTTVTTTTTTGTTTTGPPPPALIPPGVTIAGIPVGGLSPDDAIFTVTERFERPLRLVLSRRKQLTPSPYALGANARIETAVERARLAQPGEDVPLTILVSGSVLRAYVADVTRRFSRQPRDARVFLRHLRPRITSDRPGRAIDRRRLAATIHRRLLSMSRAGIRIRRLFALAAVRRDAFRSVIVIRRGSNQLRLYHYERPRRTFRVATGQSIYPTPLGRFRIVVKWRNPWWYPPNSRWAQGQKPIPPGPGNPLGTRWMGLSAPGVGIHGTPNGGSIGYSVSHGCIRMYIPDAEWLFNTVDIGTTVFIVGA